MARARAQHEDAVTGVSRLRPLRGTRPTGVFVARVRPRKGGASVLVRVNRSELVEGDESIAIHPSALASIRQRATAELARQKAREADKRKAKRAVRRTYRSASAAAREIINGNERFFEDAIETGDPQDHVRDWLAGIDVRRGRGHKRFLETKKGQAIWNAHKGSQRSKGPLAALTWIFGQNKSRRWADVDWDLVRGYEEALRAGDPDLSLPPLELPTQVASSSAEEVAMIEAEHGSEAARGAATRSNVAALEDYREQLRDAYREAGKCIDPEDRAVVRRRIRDLAALISDDDAINNETLCEPEGDTWLCDFPGVRAEVRRIRDACEAMPKAAEPIDDLDLPWERGEAPPEDLDLPWERDEPPEPPPPTEPRNPSPAPKLEPRHRAALEYNIGGGVSGVGKVVALEHKETGIGSVWRARSPVPEFSDDPTYWQYLIAPGGTTAAQVRAYLDSRWHGDDMQWILQQPTATQIRNNPHGGGAKTMARRKKKATRRKKKATRRKAPRRKATKRKSTKRKSTKRKATKRKSTKRKSTKRKSTKRRTSKKRTAKREAPRKVQEKRLTAALRAAV